MPTNTSKFNLVKPLKSEKYNVDVFNGNADIIDSQIYSKTEVDTALDGKVNTTTTVNNQPLSSNIIINASGVPNTPNGNISATNVQNAINELDTEKVDKLFATNLITNGDFSQGTTGWSSANTATLTALTNKIKIDGDGASATPRAIQSNIMPYVSGNKVYARAKLKVVLGPANVIGVDLSATGMTTQSSIISSPITNQEYVISNIYNLAAGGSGNVNIQVRHSYSTAADSIGKSMEVSYILSINLTALFGAGNEPTKEEMDRLLSVYPNSWFNGTSEIGSIGALMRASLGGQVITPTLLNSRTGSAQYVVSSDGLVIFRGTASSGSLNTNIFVLPENIRPLATRVFPISANNAFGVITVATNGEVRQTVGALTNVFLDGIVFKVGV